MQMLFLSVLTYSMAKIYNIFTGSFINSKVTRLSFLTIILNLC